MTYNVKGAAKLAEGLVNLAFTDAVRPIINSLGLKRNRDLREFANGKFLQMWCDVYSYDVEPVQKSLLDKLDKTKEEYYKGL